MKILTFYSRLIRGVICLTLLAMNSLNVYSQTMEPPGIDWYNSYWDDEDLCNNEVEQQYSGEDWFYDVNISKDNMGNVNGLICTGYVGKQCNTANCGNNCTNSADHCELRDSYQNVDLGKDKKCLVWFVDLFGHEKWYVELGEGHESIEGRKIIQIADGDYVVCGVITQFPETTYVDHIPYNPGATTNSSQMPDDGKQRGFVAKIDKTTHSILWMYTYSIENDIHSGTNYESYFADIIENGNNDLFVGGRANSPYTNTPGIEQAIVFCLDTDGILKWKSIINYQDGVDDWSQTFSEFNCLKLAPNGSITAAGSIAPLDKSFRYDGTQSYVANIVFNSSGPTAIINNKYGTLINPSGGVYVNFIYDMEYLGNGKLIAPSIEKCPNCTYYAGMPAECHIYELSTTNLSILNPTTAIDLGPLAAYDMQSGIDKTSDNGFVFVTTKRTSTPANTSVLLENGTYTANFNNSYPPTSGDCPNWFWNTDAYVAKFDGNVNLEWEKTYPFTKYDNTVTNRGDITRHECLYEIVQMPDGSFLACGNNSANLDDCILLKLNSDCENRIMSTYDIGSTATSSSYTYLISSNITWTSNMKIRGTVLVKSGYTLTIDNGAVIKFADTRATDIPTTLIVEAGARLIIKGKSKLTSLTDCSNSSVWDGIQVYGDETKTQTPSYQGYCKIDDATIEHARIGVRLSESYYENEYNWYTPLYSKTGGIIETYKAHFIDNWKDVEFMKYNSPSGARNVSHFDKSEFIYTGGFPNQSYFLDGNSEYTGYKEYVTLWDVQGVKFLGCNFENTTSDYLKDKGTGIYSINATYDVDNFMELISGSPSITHSSFKNIFRGVQAFMYSPVNGPTLNISNSTFDHVRQGVGINGFTLPYPVISNNRMTIETDGSILRDAGDAWGVHATGCDYYYIQENNITSDFIADPELIQRSVVGIAINNRHDYNTIVYKNSIDHMRTSILPFGQNGTKGDDDGLIIKCNKQTNNFENDIKVMDDGYGSGAIPGSVKDNQGGCTTNYGDDYLTPAANTFTDLTGGASTIHLNTGSLTTAYNYYYRLGVTPETPTTFTTIVTPIGCNLTYSDKLCETKIIIDDGSEHGDDGGGWHDKIASAETETERENLEKMYFTYLMNHNQAAQIITYLLGKSPTNKHDSITLAYAYSAVKLYDSAIFVLNAIVNTDSNIYFLKRVIQEIRDTDIVYQTKTLFTDSLFAYALDSTNMKSLYAENILRLSNNKYYPFRIPQNDSGANKKQSEIVRNSSLNSPSNISIYPNPNKGEFTVLLNELTVKEGYSIYVYDIIGRRIYSEKIVEKKLSYNIKLNNAKGTYIVRIENKRGDQIVNSKVTIK